MWNRNRNINLMLVLLVAVIIGSVLSAPMYYKRKDNDIFEPGKFSFLEIQKNVESVQKRHLDTLNASCIKSARQSEERRKTI